MLVMMLLNKEPLKDEIPKVVPNRKDPNKPVPPENPK